MTRWQKCDDSICPQHQRHIRISTRAINQLSRVTCLHVWQYLQLSPCARAGAHILVTWTLLFDILVSLEKGNYLYLLMLGCCRAATGVKKRNFMLFTRSCKVAPDARFLMVLCLQILSSSKNPEIYCYYRSKESLFLRKMCVIDICGETFPVRAASWYGGVAGEWQTGRCKCHYKFHGV